MGTKNNARYWMGMVWDAVLDVVTSRKAQARFFTGMWIGVELVLLLSDIHTFRDLALWIASGWMVAAYFCIMLPLGEKSKPVIDIKSARVEVNADGQTAIIAVDAALHVSELLPGDEGYADAVAQILAVQPGLAGLFAENASE